MRGGLILSGPPGRKILLSKDGQTSSIVHIKQYKMHPVIERRRHSAVENIDTVQKRWLSPNMHNKNTHNKFCCV